MIEGMPLPATDDPLDREFWSKARDGKLVVQACGDCGTSRFPPRPMCPHCQSENVTWRDDPGTATIWSFATPRPPLLPAFEAITPYITVIGALDSDPMIRIAGMAVTGADDAFTGLTAEDVEIGQPLTIHFQTVSPDCALPVWRLGPRI
ncbi:hypothetical protein MB02_02985 [Croceicoccus estronivorus]|uniref:Zn-ribbon domain-containing OB-fold protein n=1 Tax=Croceicoccus estronivorus TaxID=1172626 RepID=UPI00082F5733|nr:zinc ribbon domain-containing protein [Croceicoccus estronivorus]OCC25609.1 hypothetical protein MB02_02985 [Croceicoccus estronivorus]